MEHVSNGIRSSSIDNLSNFLSCWKAILQEPVTGVLAANQSITVFMILLFDQSSNPPK